MYIGELVLSPSHHPLSDSCMTATTNVSILQLEVNSSSLLVILPLSFVALRRIKTDTGLTSLLPKPQQFLNDKELKILKELQGQAVEKVANFLDEVRRLIVSQAMANCN